MNRRQWLSILPATVAGRTSAARGDWPASSSLYIDYRARPAIQNVRSHSHSIVDALAELDVAAARKEGTKLLAYLSLVEVAGNTERDKQAKSRGVPFVGQNEAWASKLMTVGSRQWQDFLMLDGIEPIKRSGFDGIFFDTADSLQLLPEARQRAAASEAIVTLLGDVKSSWPQGEIWLNRGFDLLPRLCGIVSTVLVESVYQTFDSATRKHRSVSRDDSAWIEKKIFDTKRLGFRVAAVDYVPPAQSKLAVETVERLRNLGVLPLITTPDLSGVVVAPRRQTQLQIPETPSSQGRK